MGGGARAINNFLWLFYVGKIFALSALRRTDPNFGPVLCMLTYTVAGNVKEIMKALDNLEWEMKLRCAM